MFFNADRSIVPVWSPDSRYLTYAKHLPSFVSRRVCVRHPNWQERADHRWLGGCHESGVGCRWQISVVHGVDGLRFELVAAGHVGVRSSADERAVRCGAGQNEPSPLLPESDEEAARAGAAPRDPNAPAMPRTDSASRTARPAGSDSANASDANAARNARRATVIDFDGIQQRIIAVQDVALRNYAQLQAGPVGSVFFLEPVPASGTGSGGPGGAAGGGGNTLHRYELRTRPGDTLRAGCFAV